MHQEEKIGTNLVIALPPPNSTLQSALSSPSHRVGARPQWNWELDEVCLYWFCPLVSLLVSGSWSLQKPTLLYPSLADIWTMIQVTAETPPSKFNYILTQDSWRINVKTRLLCSKSKSHWGFGLGALIHCCLKSYFMQAHRVCTREECLAHTKEDHSIWWMRKWGLERGHNS